MRVLALVVALATVLLAHPLGASAAPADGKAALTVTPVSFERTVERGGTTDGVIEVFNVGEAPVEIRAEVVGMTADARGTSFGPDERPYSLEAFVRIDRNSIRLRPGEARRVPFRIEVPKGAWPGGYYGAIFFRTGVPDAGAGASSVQQAARIGTILALRTTGPADRSGKIGRLEVGGGPLTTSRRIRTAFENTGNVDKPPLGIAYRPVGRVDVRNAFGRVVDRRRLEGNRLLPGGVDTFDLSVRRWFWLGRYKVQARLATGAGERATTRNATFWTASPAAIGALGVVALVIAGLIALRRRRAAWRKFYEDPQADPSDPP